MKLLLVQKNELFRSIQQHGFTPENFRFSETVNDRNGYDKTDIYYKDSEFSFTISHAVGYRPIVNLSPTLTGYRDTHNCENWEDITTLFGEWLFALYQEVNQEDLWKRMYEQKATFQDFTMEDEGKFSTSEIKLVNQKLDEIKIEVSKIGLSVQQLKVIEQKIDVMASTMDKVTKKDWIVMFIGLIVNALNEYAFTAEHTMAVIHLIKSKLIFFLLGA